MQLYSAVLLFTALLGSCHSSKILAVFPFFSRSHYILGDSLLKGLAQRGHDVTMISAFKTDKPMDNYKEVILDGMLEFKEQYADRMTNVNVGIWERLNLMIEIFPALYNEIHNNTNLKNFLKKGEKFDVCIVSFMAIESAFKICDIVQAPSIGFNLGGMHSILSYHTSNPTPFSYVPSVFFGFSDNMTFLQRVQNILSHYFIEGLYHFIAMPYHQKILDRYYPNSPTIEELMDRVDLYLMNSHISTDSPKPLLPNVIPIGGYHLQIKDEIPIDIKNFLDQSKRGVIYFTLGSNVQSSNLEPQIKEALINTFAKVNYDVLWKYETDLPNKPKNVFTAKWLPQRPILMHPNVKIFMTHGGLGGTVEAIYGGVPMICMPIFGDQGKNCAESTDNGYALTVDLGSLTEEKLTNAINEIINNPTFKEKIALSSDIYKNQETNPMDKAAFWVEHVIRHKGAKHLKSRASRIPWYQYYLLDVISFLSGAVLLLLILGYFILKLNLRVLCWVFRKITGKGKNTSADKPKLKKN